MRLIAFGRPYLARADGEEVALQPLPVAVLAYLAVGGPRDRDHLADLFWHSTKNGLNSLSTTLNRIRARMPDSVWVQGNSLVGTDLSSDVSELREAIARADFDSITTLYSAPFLGSLKLRRQSGEFEEWVLETRATLASTVELALLQHGRSLALAGEHDVAADAAERAWEIAIRDGFPSPDYFETYHQLLASTARPVAKTVRTMAEEFGVSLAAVQPIAFGSIAERAPVRAEATTDHPVALGAATPLFGFEDELDALAAAVASSRFTTIVGFGGSGKTRLAAEFFASPTMLAQDFSQRHWVNLREVSDHSLVAPTIAAALGFTFSDVAMLADQLPEDGPILVVLDNFEHVLDAAPLVDELLAGNDALRLLVTSRVPLGRSGESVVPLAGLDSSHHDVASPAEQLFVASARRAGVAPDRVGETNRAAIREVCLSVGGNPLALELVGGWAQILSPAEILEALSSDSGLLGESIVGDLRSMEAVLNQSWLTLAETERHTLMMLATFPGGCLTQEALHLPELPIRSIGRLVQHSLVRLHVEGRITLHPLIARYALSELEQNAPLHYEFHEVLGRWCQRFAAAVGPKPKRTHAQTFDAEIANFTSAWSWAAEHRRWDIHRETVWALRQFFNESGRTTEGRALFTVTAAALASDPDRPADVLAAVLEALGWCHLASGELTQARSRLGEALELSSDGDPHARSQILRSLGVLQLNTGEFEGATANFNAGLTLIADEPSALTASLQYDLAQAHRASGALDEATATARLALQSGLATNDHTVMATSYLLLADIAVESDPRRAIVLLDEGRVIANDAGLDNLAIYFPSIAGLAYLRLGDAALAENSFTEGIEAANKVGQLMTVCGNYVGRAEARLLSEAAPDACDDLRSAIRLALKTGHGPYLLWAAVVSCRAVPEVGAKELLKLAIRHPAIAQDERDKALASLRDLFDEAEDADLEPLGDEDGARLVEIAERSLQLLAVAEG